MSEVVPRVFTKRKLFDKLVVYKCILPNLDAAFILYPHCICPTLKLPIRNRLCILNIWMKITRCPRP